MELERHTIGSSTASSTRQTHREHLQMTRRSGYAILVDSCSAIPAIFLVPLLSRTRIASRATLAGLMLNWAAFFTTSCLEIWSRWTRRCSCPH